MSKRKLLLADDSITIQKVVNLTFADEGIEVISVGDGDSAMQKIYESAPDLVLADVNMPGMSGYQICEKLKQNAATQSIPVILLVGSFEPFDEAEAYRVGADDYLTKPFQSIRQLVSKVSDLLESTNGVQTASVESVEQNVAAVPDITAESNVEQSAGADFYTVDAYSSDVYSVNANDYTGNSVNLDDAGTDDEMIQTAQVGSLPVDETQKFIPASQTGQTGESSAYEPVYTDFEPQFNLIEEAPPQKDSRKTQLSSEEIFQLFSEDNEEEINKENTSENNKETGSATVYDFSTGIGNSKPAVTENQIFSSDETLEIGDVPQQNSKQYEKQDNFISDSENIFDDIPPAAASSDRSFDDMDLLELPTTKPNSYEAASATKRTAKSADPAAEKGGKGTERVNQFSRLSPEMIEAIAQKVAEKISDKAIREIAWELVPQLTAAIIKKMEQERPKE